MAVITSESTPPRQTDALANPVCSPRSAPSGTSSSTGHSIPTGRNCIICAGPGPAWRAKQTASSLRSAETAFHLNMTGHLNSRLSSRGRLRARDSARPWRSRTAASSPSIIAMNGPSHDAAALCNSRRLSQSDLTARGLVEDRGSRRRHGVQPAVRFARGRGRRAEGFRDHLRDARAHAVSARAVCGLAEAETPDHLRHAQCRDRSGSRERPSGGAVRHAMGPRSDRGADDGPDPGTDPPYRPRKRPHACRRTLAEIHRPRDRGPDTWRRRPRQARQPRFRDWQKRSA